MDDTLSILLGGWSLERVLEDHLSGTGGRFEGTASVTLVKGGAGAGGELDATAGTGHGAAVYEERGRIEFGAHRGPSHRALRFTRLPDGRAAVWFADGRPFFELDLRSGRCEALHPCRADDYRLLFELTSPDLIVERWRVRGPDKNYDAETLWRRLG